MKKRSGGTYFPLPIEIFRLGLSTGAVAVYAYLMCCENRTTHKCWPSYRAIGRAVGMASKNTVSKYLYELVERDLICMEQTQVRNKTGRKRNGTMMITLLPLSGALEARRQREQDRLEMFSRKQKLAKELKAHPLPDFQFRFSEPKGQAG